MTQSDGAEGRTAQRGPDSEERERSEPFDRTLRTSAATGSGTGTSSMHMTESLRDLRLFVAAYEEGSFTAAAARENTTQSGVSQHMHKLEAGFGVPLFVRGAGSIMPTPAGEMYYRHCIEILRAFQLSKADMAAFGAGLSGDVRVGLMPTLTRCALAPALKAFVKAHPNARVRVIEGYSSTLTERVSSGEFAFAIVPSFHTRVGLRARPFLSTPEVLVSARGSSPPHKVPVKLRELPPLRLVLPSHENTRRQTLETSLSSNGARIQAILELDAMMGTLDLVATSDWATILPGVMMAADLDRDRFNVNPIVDPVLNLELVLIEPARAPMDPTAKAFLQVLESEAGRMNACWSKPIAESKAGQASKGVNGDAGTAVGVATRAARQREARTDKLDVSLA